MYLWSDYGPTMVQLWSNYGPPPSGETVETVEYSGEKVATERDSSFSRCQSSPRVECSDTDKLGAATFTIITIISKPNNHR